MPDKPAGQSWESFIDSLVTRSMRDGEFDSLAGKGKPIAGLDEPYRDDWWLRAFLKRENLSVPCTALEVRAEVERELENIFTLTDEKSVKRGLESLNQKIAAANRTVISGPSTSLARLNIDQVIARWRQRRS